MMAGYPAFPYSPLPVGLELYVGGAWVDVTADLDRGGVSSSRGRSDESDQVDPGAFSFRLNNATGKYSPRNPASPYYGQLGRNTPLKFWAELGRPRAVQPGGGHYWQTTDKAALDVTGDLDLRVDLRPQSWRPNAPAWLGVLKSNAYGLYVSTAGKLVLQWYDSGGVGRTLQSAVPIPGGLVGRKQVRATLDVNNGAGGRTAAFYVWSGGTWVQFSSVTTAVPTTIQNSTAALSTYTSSELGGTSIYSVQVRNGIGGTLVANPIFTNQAGGTTSFSDGLGNTWTPVGDAKCWNRHYRFNAEVSEWPARWGEKGATESFVEVKASGVLRRLNQGAPPVKSAIYGGCVALPNLLSYWPCEDGDTDTGISGYGSTSAARIYGTIDLAAYSGLPASAPLPQLGTGRAVFTCIPASATGQSQFRMVVNMPTAPAAGTTIARFWTNSSLAYADLVYSTGGALGLTAYTADGASLGYTNTIFGTSLLHGAPYRLSIELAQNGAYVDLKVGIVQVGASVGSYGTATTTGACTVGAPKAIDLNPFSADLSDTAFGHVTTERAITSFFDLGAQLKGYDGEPANVRLARLAAEHGLDLDILGYFAASQTCGPQAIDSVLGLIRETAEIDGGLLYEPDTEGTLAYRPLDTITGQDPLVLPYVENMFRPFEPTEDDQATRNDVTVVRRHGGAYTATDTSGPLGVDTIGRYVTEETLNVSAGDERWQAQWALALGTVDDLRWPQIGFNLADPRILADPDLVLALLEIDLGDRIRITGLPVWLPPFPADVIVQGISATIAPDSWEIVFNTSPATPINVLGIDWEARWDAESTLAASASSTATTLSVATAVKPLWSIVDGPFDVVVGGERMTVTNVTGSASPQTFTVTRSVNGVVKAQTAGTSLVLAEPDIYGL